MQIPCISCQSRFRLDNSLVKATGSLVRCSKCKYIFMVYPPAFNDEPVAQDANIDQSVLDDLFEIEQKNRLKGILDQTADEINNQRVNEIASIGAFEEEEDPDSGIEDIEYAELPDSSEKSF